MTRVAEFEKVSFTQFKEAMIGLGGYYADEEFIRESYNNVTIPERATSGSAGYDFKLPFAIHLDTGEGIKIPTGIRVKIVDGWFLGCFPRSGLGFKYRMQLDNSVGIIDGDYYFSDNEGHIFAKITNDGKEGKSFSLSARDSFMQGIFLPYGLTYADNVKTIRNGGFGSTDNKNTK